MSNKPQIIDTLTEPLVKYGAWIAYVLIGLAGKFGWDIYAKKKISAWYVVGTTLMAFFVGFVSSQWFIRNSPTSGAYWVPIMTLASRDILMCIRLIDWTKVLSAIFKVEIKQKQNDK